MVGQQRVMCMCSDCCKKPEEERQFSCTQYEQHCGAGAAKKWKASLRVEPGCVPEVPEGDHHLTHAMTYLVAAVTCITTTTLLCFATTVVTSTATCRTKSMSGAHRVVTGQQLSLVDAFVPLIFFQSIPVDIAATAGEAHVSSLLFILIPSCCTHYGLYCHEA